MKIDILNSTKSFKWDGIEVPMVLRGYWDKEKIAQFWKQESSTELDVEAEITITRQLQESYVTKIF